jgi:hypothetical protein
MSPQIKRLILSRRNKEGAPESPQPIPVSPDSLLSPSLPRNSGDAPSVPGFLVPGFLQNWIPRYA